jgi:hypothetical protein
MGDPMSNMTGLKEYQTQLLGINPSYRRKQGFILRGAYFEDLKH